MSSPTQRTLKECKKRGWEAQVVERWNQYSRTRLDLFGCIDIVATTGSAVLGIQACAGASHAARREKALAEPRIAKWIASGGEFWIWSWAKRGARGKRKVWTLREERLLLTDYIPMPAAHAIDCDMGEDCNCGRAA